MKNNFEVIASVIDYIESHLSEDFDLDTLAEVTGYSKYHLHRMFTGLIGFSIHSYIVRRKLTEAAKRMLFSEDSILEIALDSGYESQQAFSQAFKDLYKDPPDKFRRKHEFCPIQMKYVVDGNLSSLRSDRIMEINTVESGDICLVGYMANTHNGFLVIPSLWRKLHKLKMNIPNRIHSEFLIGLNDYSGSPSFSDKQPAFDYYAAVEVSKIDQIPDKMKSIILLAGKYVVFTFHAKSQDSLQPVADYIYKMWFLQSSCQLNDKARYDFARYFEEVDAEGKSRIEFWVPIC